MDGKIVSVWYKYWMNFRENFTKLTFTYYTIRLTFIQIIDNIIFVLRSRAPVRILRNSKKSKLFSEHCYCSGVALLKNKNIWIYLNIEILLKFMSWAKVSCIYHNRGGQRWETWQARLEQRHNWRVCMYGMLWHVRRIIVCVNCNELTHW